MTNHVMLSSSPSVTKAKLQRVPPMPYEFWSNILKYKLKSWFKVYQTKHQDPVKVFNFFFLIINFAYNVREKNTEN